MVRADRCRVNRAAACDLAEAALSTGTGDAIVSDGDGGGIYRLAVHGAAFERLDRGEQAQNNAVMPG